MIRRMLLVGSLTFTGCSSGLQHLLAGLVVEEWFDQDGVQGGGLACYDLNANGECDGDEDSNADGFCDALDCRGDPGMDGTDGLDGAAGGRGLAGSPGRPIVLPPPVVIVLPPVIVQPDDADDDPAGGHPPFGRGPVEHPPHPGESRP